MRHELVIVSDARILPVGRLGAMDVAECTVYRSDRVRFFAHPSRCARNDSILVAHSSSNEWACEKLRRVDRRESPGARKGQACPRIQQAEDFPHDVESIL